MIASDGDLMEGVAAEASSLRGHLGLGRLIVFYDDNQITIDGKTDSPSAKTSESGIEAYGWHILQVDGHDVEARREAIRSRARSGPTSRASSSPRRSSAGARPTRGTSAAHSDPMGKEPSRPSGRRLGWPDETFYVPDECARSLRQAKGAGGKGERSVEGAVRGLVEDESRVRKAWDARSRLRFPADLACPPSPRWALTQSRLGPPRAR